MWTKYYTRKYNIQRHEVLIKSFEYLKYNSDIIIIPENEKESFFYKKEDWDLFEKRLFDESMTDFESNVKKWEKTGEDFLSVCESIYKKEISRISNNELVKLYEEFYLIYLKFFATSVCIPFIIQRLLDEKVQGEEIGENFTSIALQEQIELSKVKDEKELKEHYEKYKWLSVYDIDDEPLTLDYFQKAWENKSEIKTKHFESSKEIVKKWQLNAFIRDKRDEHRRKGQFYIQKLFIEMGKRLNLSLKEICYLNKNEIISLLKGKDLKINVGERTQGYVYYYKEGKHQIYSGKEGEEIVKEEFPGLNPDNELFIWGPIDGRPIYVSYFMVANEEVLPVKYKYRWPNYHFYFNKEKMTFICDYNDLRQEGLKHFNEWIMNEENFKKVWTIYEEVLVKLNEIQEKIKGMNENSFIELYKEWHNTYIEFWGVCLISEMANYGAEDYLKKILNEKVKDNFAYVFEKMSAPDKYGFYQQEEIDLFHAKDLEKHAEKYFWIRNNYFEQTKLDAEYFKKHIPTKEKIKEIEEYPKKVLDEKKKLANKYNFNEDIMKFVEKFSYSQWWQDVRKAEVWKANHYLDLFLEQFSKKFQIPVLDLKYYTAHDLIKLSNGEKIDVVKRKEFVDFFYDGKLNVNTEDKDVVEKLLHKEIDDVDELKGMIVSSGKGSVSGKVHILMSPRHVDEMKEGEILVAPMTSPDYVVAMRKAKAIITDEGGMTSHAAIVSRELGIPCIVGTKIATKVLKDGDNVEVDVKNGVVKK